MGGANRSAACLSQLGARLAHDEAGTLGGLSDWTSGTHLRQMPMRIVVFGASSGIGRELVLQARTGGHHAVAVARSIGSEAAASLTPVRGSVLDPGVAERAVAGADAVAWCVGVRTLGPAFLRKVTVFSEGTRRAIEAMQEAGVSRLAVITGIGAGESRGHGGLLYEWIGLPLIVGGIYADKDRQEAIVKASGLNWTIVRPTLLTNGPRTGQYRVLINFEGVHGGRISRADCADCLIARSSRVHGRGRQSR